VSTLFDLTPEAPAAAAAGPRPTITITAYGLPAPQGSKRHVGRGVMIESSKKVKPWRQDVKHAALDTTEALDSWAILDGPLAVAMTFTFDRPKGHYRTGRNAHLLRGTAPIRPAGMPDLSKLARSTEDALTGVVWKDDARVVEYVRLGKWYAGTDADDVLPVPGCVIRVWRLEALTGYQWPEREQVTAR
jgi:Holliday junction resolvase RusA-like endonuclease